MGRGVIVGANVGTGDARGVAVVRKGIEVTLHPMLTNAIKMSIIPRDFMKCLYRMIHKLSML